MEVASAMLHNAHTENNRPKSEAHILTLFYF